MPASRVQSLGRWSSWRCRVVAAYLRPALLNRPLSTSCVIFPTRSLLLQPTNIAPFLQPRASKTFYLSHQPKPTSAIVAPPPLACSLARTNRHIQYTKHQPPAFHRRHNPLISHAQPTTPAIPTTYLLQPTPWLSNCHHPSSASSVCLPDPSIQLAR